MDFIPNILCHKLCPILLLLCLRWNISDFASTISLCRLHYWTLLEMCANRLEMWVLQLYIPKPWPIVCQCSHHWENTPLCHLHISRCGSLCAAPYSVTQWDCADSSQCLMERLLYPASLGRGHDDLGRPAAPKQVHTVAISLTYDSVKPPWNLKVEWKSFRIQNVMHQNL